MQPFLSYRQAASWPFPKLPKISWQCEQTRTLAANSIPIPTQIVGSSSSAPHRNLSPAPNAAQVFTSLCEIPFPRISAMFAWHSLLATSLGAPTLSKQAIPPPWYCQGIKSGCLTSIPSKGEKKKPLKFDSFAWFWSICGRILYSD